MKSSFIALILLLCVASFSHAARFDTSFSYSTLQTANFSIHYHQGLEEAARKTARIAEETHGKLVQEFLWQPAGKTQVVLIDDSDFTNGFAVTIPYNTIYLQLVPPSIASTLGEYDDWLKVLFTHEYAHILSSDAARGYSKVTRAVFGKPLPWADPLSALFFLFTAPPNTFMPRWWHEGVATWAETKHTGQGRGSGTFYDMVFRAAVAEDNLPSVDQINGDVPFWPAGSHPYMYGYRLQRHIAENYGADAVGKLSSAHAGRLPYLIDNPAQELLAGNSYRNVYDEMIEAVKKGQSQKIERLSRVPFTPLRPIRSDGENLTNPRLSPDGTRLAFTRRDPHDHASTVITDGTGDKVVARFRRRYSDGSISWSPDGKSVYFTQAEVDRGFNVYQDLYVYHLGQDRIDRLTKGERLGEVQIDPTGKRFVAVVSSRGSQNLALMEAAAPGVGKRPGAITDYSLQRVSAPRWSPDGQAICYVVTDNAGASTIRVLDTRSRTDQPLIKRDNTLAYPAWSPDGATIYYISDETGVFNLFAYDLKARKSYQASHLLTGALQPEPSPDGSGMLLASYSSRGFKIARMELDRARWREAGEAPLPLSETLVQAPGAEAKTPLPASDYQAWKTLYPRFWLPRFYDDNSDGIVLGAFTMGADVLGYNSYAVSATYSEGRQRGYYSLIYNNDYFYPTLSLKAHSEPFLYGNLYQRGADYYELNRGVSLEASVPINFLESSYRIRAGYELLDQKALTRLSGDGTLNGVPVFQGRRDNVFAGIAYRGAEKYPYSISSEQGRNLSFLYRYFGKEIGSDQELSEYSAAYEEYLRLPKGMLPHHVIYLRLSGAVADGDQPYGQEALQIGGAPSEYNSYPLRGYPARSVTGKRLATGTVEYRAPLAYPLRGVDTLPAFLEKLHAALFADAGKVWDSGGSLQNDDLRIGGGVELRADLTLGYWAKVTPALGFAHGFNSGGENQLYFTLYLGL